VQIAINSAAGLQRRHAGLVGRRIYALTAAVHIQAGTAMLAAWLCMLFVLAGDKTLGIQIATSGKARPVRTLDGHKLSSVKLDVLAAVQ